MPEPTFRDEQAAALRARYPGWHVWYVPRAAGAGTWWSAQPARYPLVAASADELAALIDADQAGDGRTPGQDN